MGALPLWRGCCRRPKCSRRQSHLWEQLPSWLVAELRKRRRRLKRQCGLQLTQRSAQPLGLPAAMQALPSEGSQRGQTLQASLVA